MAIRSQMEQLLDVTSCPAMTIGLSHATLSLANSAILPTVASIYIYTDAANLVNGCWWRIGRAGWCLTWPVW